MTDETDVGNADRTAGRSGDVHVGLDALPDSMCNCLCHSGVGVAHLIPCCSQSVNPTYDKTEQLQEETKRLAKLNQIYFYENERLNIRVRKLEAILADFLIAKESL